VLVHIEGLAIMKLGKIELPKACDKYGASMGRSSILPVDTNVSVQLRLIHLDLDSGGYDKGGAYWGFPNNLYWAESIDEFPVSYSLNSKLQLSVRASSREEAKSKIKDILPNATFFR